MNSVCEEVDTLEVVHIREFLVSATWLASTNGREEVIDSPYKLLFLTETKFSTFGLTR